MSDSIWLATIAMPYESAMWYAAGPTKDDAKNLGLEGLEEFDDRPDNPNWKDSSGYAYVDDTYHTLEVREVEFEEIVD